MFLKVGMFYFFLRLHQDEAVIVELTHRIPRQMFHIVTACYFSYPLNGSHGPGHTLDAHFKK